MGKKRSKEINMCVKRVEKMINTSKAIRDKYSKDKFIIDSMNSILEELRELRICIIKIDTKQEENCNISEYINYILSLREQEIKRYNEVG